MLTALAVRHTSAMSPSSLLSPFFNKSKKDLKRHWGLTAAGMVEVYAGDHAAPPVQQAYQPAGRKMRRNQGFWEVRNTDPIERDIQHQI